MLLVSGSLLRFAKIALFIRKIEPTTPQLRVHHVICCAIGVSVYRTRHATLTCSAVFVSTHFTSQFVYHTSLQRFACYEPKNHGIPASE